MAMDLSAMQARIRSASAQHTALCIRGGGSKEFYGGELTGEPFDMSHYTGIVDYEPTELTVTVRAGTRLCDLERVLEERAQCLAFEPPRFGRLATVGGAVASGFSGPRRAYQGALRDFVLGIRMLDGRGADLRFGGKVIKNVAGFDVSRLLAGSFGTLGVLLEVTLKTLPCPTAECTLRFAMDEATALLEINRWAARALPLSATAWQAGLLSVRLSGAAAAVRAARQTLGGELTEGRDYWERLRDQRLDRFAAPELWRVSVPATQPPLTSTAPPLLEWGGALRWLEGPLDATALQAQLAPRGGFAVRYRGTPRAAAPLGAPALALHRRLKAVFDPAGIFNRGRLHPAL